MNDDVAKTRKPKDRYAEGSLAAVMLLCFLPHRPTATTPPIKPKAALLQPLMMHYEFDPDMFDNFWFPLFV